jgi:sarcosine oxidase
VNNWDIIVGAGAVGGAALRAASEAGARVLGIEQLAPAHTRGSSHGHSRIFRHAYFEHPDYVPLLGHSTARFESLERQSGASLLNRCGMLVAGRDDSAVVRATLASAQRWALPQDSLDAGALRGRTELPIGFLSAAQFVQ